MTRNEPELSQMKTAPLTLGIAALLALSACGSNDDNQNSTAADRRTANADQSSDDAVVSEAPAAAEESRDTATETEPEPKPEPEPEPEALEVHQIGEKIESPTADLVVEVVEQRDSIPTSFDGPIEPNSGERLWYIDITWTNNLEQAVGKECHGPYEMRLHAFDLEGREMLMTDQPGMIEGQECTIGLMQGQTGRWQSAFHGLDEDFGWLVFDDYNGEPVLVVQDPDLELYVDR